MQKKGGMRVGWTGAWIFVAALAIWPETALEAARSAMEAWAISVAPALFPFMAATPALTCPEARGAYERLLGRVFAPLFRVPASASGAIVIGLLAGSPAGAAALKRTMAEERYSRGEAFRAAALASGVSPMFLIGGVGVALLGSRAAGLLLMRTQLMALALGGLFLRFWPVDESPAPVPGAPEIKDAIGSILGVCGNMIVFSVGAALIARPLSGGARTLVSAAAEIAMGMRALAGLPLPVLSAAAGFTGVCILCQNASALAPCGVRLRALLPVKLLHAALSFILCEIQLLCFPLAQTASAGGANPAAPSLAALAMMAVTIVASLCGKTRRAGGGARGFRPRFAAGGRTRR